MVWPISTPVLRNSLGNAQLRRTHRGAHSDRPRSMQPFWIKRRAAEEPDVLKQNRAGAVLEALRC